MKLISVCCNHCGAPLDVSEQSRFVTCSHCNSRLIVQHTGNAVYTELLESLQQRTEEIADEVELLRLQADLTQLESDWEKCDTNDASAMVYRCVVVSLLGTLLAIVLFVANDPLSIPLGILILVVVVGWIIYQSEEVALFRCRQRDYEGCKADLQFQIHELRTQRGAQQDNLTFPHDSA